MDSFAFAVVAAEEDRETKKDLKVQRQTLRDRSNPFEIDDET